MPSPQKITTYLWFNGNAEEAVEFDRSVFPNSRVTDVARWGEGGPGPQGTVMNIAFELAGQGFIALNALIDLMSDPDPKASGGVAQALMGMQKIDDLAALRRVHAAA